MGTIARIFSKLVTLVLFITVVSCDSSDDNMPPPTASAMSIEDFTINEGDEDSFLFVRLTLSKSSETLISARISTQSGTAEDGTDFIGFADVPVVFEPGALTGEYRMTILGDDDPEIDERFTVTIISAEGASIAKPTATITIENDEASVGPIVIPSSGYCTPETYPGMDLIWSDEFSGDEIDESNWTFEIGNGNWGWGNNEQQYYRKENAQIYEDNLVITAKNESFSNFNYTSTRMKTQNKFDFKYGRVDIRANLPFGQGIWPALWMLGSNFSSVGWPSCGEIDIMELIGHQPGRVYGTAHWENTAGNHASFGGNTNLPSGIFNDEYHVFSIIWDQFSIRWLVDDQEYHVLSITDADLSELNNEHFFIFNIACGGLWPGNPDASTQFPQHMIVDYIRVFQ